MAAELIEHLAAECREEIKVMFDEVLPQTGFRRPVKIVVNKDTTKYRTRQAVCVSSIFPEADELIQTVYIDHLIIRHYKAEDTAQNIHDAIEPYVIPEEVEGGSCDGPYHIDKILGISDDDTHSAHYYLQQCGTSESNAMNYCKHFWAGSLSSLCSKVNNKHNFGKSYEESYNIADDMNVKFEHTFRSDTIFANPTCNVRRCFYHDLPIIIEHYEQIKEAYHISNIRREKR